MDFIFKSISNFQLPFIPDGQSLRTTPFGTLENGTRKSDSLAVTVHTYNSNKIPSSLLKNHLHKSKVLKLPGLVKVLDVIESSPEKIYVITERVTPLTSLNYKEFSGNSLKLGLFQLAQTLHVLHDQAKSLFGAVCLGNIYINQKGEWELYGLELSTSIADIQFFISNFQVYSNSVRGYDDWEIYNTKSVNTDYIQLANLFTSLLSNNISSSWKPILAQMSKGEPCIQKLITKMETGADNVLISIYENLKEIHIKDPSSKIMILSNIQQQISENSSLFKGTSPGFLEYFILPEMIQCLQLISTSNQPASNQVPFLTTILMLSCSGDDGMISEDVFQKQIKPLIFHSFTIADRQVRFLLLLHFSKFITKLSQAEVTDKVFTNFIQGLSDTDQSIRLQTLKNVSHLMGKITERQLNNDLLRVLAKTQVDKDLEIRTLTILVITKIAHKLSKSSNRSTILATAFTKSLKDPDLKPRLATLYGLEITIDLFDPETIAQRILTVIGPGLLDRNSQVRENAKKVFHLYWDKLERESASLVADDSAPHIDTAEFEKMLSDNEDGNLINGFIQTIKRNTPTPTSTPAALSQEIDPWDSSLDDHFADDNWDFEEPAPVKPLGSVVTVQKSWNDELNEDINAHKNERNSVFQIRNSLSTKKKPSILSKSNLKTSVLKKNPQYIVPKVTHPVKKPSSTPFEFKGDHDDVEDGWGDDW